MQNLELWTLSTLSLTTSISSFAAEPTSIPHYEGFESSPIPIFRTIPLSGWSPVDCLLNRGLTDSQDTPDGPSEGDHHAMVAPTCFLVGCTPRPALKGVFDLSTAQKPVFKFSFWLPDGNANTISVLTSRGENPVIQILDNTIQFGTSQWQTWTLDLSDYAGERLTNITVAVEGSGVHLDHFAVYDRVDIADRKRKSFESFMTEFSEIPLSRRERSDDWDGDGATNEMEYFNGTRPDQFSSNSGVFGLTKNDSLDSVCELKFWRRKNTVGMNYTINTSESLLNFSEGVANSDFEVRLEESVTDFHDFEQVTVIAKTIRDGAPYSPEKLFFNLKVNYTGLAPREDQISSLILEETLFGGYEILSDTRFSWFDETGNWTYSKTGENTATFVLTYDENGNNPDVYREQVDFVFNTPFGGSFNYREISSGSVTSQNSGTLTSFLPN